MHENTKNILLIFQRIKKNTMRKGVGMFCESRENGRNNNGEIICVCVCVSAHTPWKAEMARGESSVVCVGGHN